MLYNNNDKNVLYDFEVLFIFMKFFAVSYCELSWVNTEKK